MNPRTLLTIIALHIAAVMVQAQQLLPLPSVPSDLTVPMQRADYIMRHFWDAMDWNDTCAARNSAFMEINMVNFFSIAPHASSDAVTSSFRDFAAHAAADSISLQLVAELSHRYLGERQSPVYHEPSYEIMCRVLADCYQPQSPQRVYLDYALQTLAKNRHGTRAADFTFIDRHGRTRTLFSTLRQGTVTLLIFFDPGCSDCHTLTAALTRDSSIARQITDGALAVTLITPFDTDPAAWQRYADTLPTAWTVGYSPLGQIDTDELYDLPAIPSIYLLAPDGTVIHRNLTTLPSDLTNTATQQ